MTTLQDLIHPLDQMGFFPSSVCCVRSKPPFLSSFSISDLGSLAGGNSEELGCNVKLQLFFFSLRWLGECCKRCSGGEKIRI